VRPSPRFLAGVELAALALSLAACASAGAASSTGVLTLATPTPAASAASGSAGATDGAGASSKPDPADFQEALLAYAQCMRDHGVDMPDPDADSGGIKVEARPGTGGGAGGTTDKIGGPDDPTFKSAFEACKSNLPKGGNNK